MDAHFGLDQLSAPKPGKPRADARDRRGAAVDERGQCCISASTQAAGLGARAIDPLSDIKSSPEPEEGFRDSWSAITRQDFLPVIDPGDVCAAHQHGAPPG